MRGNLGRLPSESSLGIWTSTAGCCGLIYGDPGSPEFPTAWTWRGLTADVSSRLDSSGYGVVVHKGVRGSLAVGLDNTPTRQVNSGERARSRTRTAEDQTPGIGVLLQRQSSDTDRNPINRHGCAELDVRGANGPDPSYQVCLPERIEPLDPDKNHRWAIGPAQGEVSVEIVVESYTGPALLPCKRENLLVGGMAHTHF